jgi:ribonuclease HII
VFECPEGAEFCGVDEAGRGPLAGPVYAAAVMLDPRRVIEGLADSKVLSAQQREELEQQIKQRARAWAIAYATVEEIDRFNILRATFLAMSRAVDALAVKPARAYVDGNRAPQLAIPVTTVVRGDSLVPAISAASILAKTARDAEMSTLDRRFPGYGFTAHKGYSTPAHLAALRLHGVSAIHRRSFSPVRALLGEAVQLSFAEDL